jgi:hypothetical protein
MLLRIMAYMLVVDSLFVIYDKVKLGHVQLVHVSILLIPAVLCYVTLIIFYPSKLLFIDT